MVETFETLAARADKLLERAAECESAGNMTAAKTYLAQARKLVPIGPIDPIGPAASEWLQWCDGDDSNITAALAFLDYSLENGTISEGQLARAQQWVRSCGAKWLTENLVG